MEIPFTTEDDNAIPLHLVTKSEADEFISGQSPATRAWIDAHLKLRTPGRCCTLPGDGGVEGILGIVDAEHFRSVGKFAKSLPQGTYKITAKHSPEKLMDAALAWSRALYKFDRHLTKKQPAALLSVTGMDASVTAQASVAYKVRDWVNTPAGELGPTALAEAAKVIVEKHGGTLRIVEGGELEKDYPMVHAVGRAATDAPRLIDMRWGNKNAPKLTIVGKGVCFDSGGLDVKPSQYMRNMKKDMGGGAHALGLADLVMTKKLPVYLRCLVPAVENAVAGNAFRPGDILKSRAGVSVEIHNTDAEGRLVLGDALSDACDEAPELLIDFATLTGAARVALGPDLPALFSRDDTLAADLVQACQSVGEPIWRMPLHEGYRDFLRSDVADCTNAASTPHAGCITAALFLDKFVKDSQAWVHIDLYAWNDSSKSYRPSGGEAQCLRGISNYLERRFSKTTS